MNYANLTVQRPDLCKGCLAGTPCTRVASRGISCMDARNLYDAGFHSGLTKIQNALAAARAQKSERIPAPPRRRPRRRIPSTTIIRAQLDPEPEET